MNDFVSPRLAENIAYLEQHLPLHTSFDLVTRNLYLGKTPAYWIGINGMCKTEVLQQIFSDLQNPLFTENDRIEDLILYMNSKIGYAQTETENDWERLLQNLLSGPSLLFVEGFDQAVILDARSYPTRGMSEPDAEPILRGARDSFVETMLFNANLLRRRVRSPHLIFSIHSVGTESRTDVAIAYLEDKVNSELLTHLVKKLQALEVTSLTMGTQSLSELLVPHRWWNPLPSIQYTERPDVASSYLLEGHILIIVDNSPLVMLLPGTIFQFTQSPQDYADSPVTGSYFRLVRFLCIPVSLFLMPAFLLITAYFPEFSARWQILSTGDKSPAYLIFYVFAVELFLDLFKYSASLNSGQFSGSLSIVGGLLIGDIAVTLNWATPEVLFYGAITLLSSISLSSSSFSDGLRIYRLLLLIATAMGGLPGFGIGLLLILFSVATTPTFGKMSYFWPLFPWNGKALYTLLFRRPTAKSQPSRVWSRGHLHE